MGRGRNKRNKRHKEAKQMLDSVSTPPMSGSNNTVANCATNFKLTIPDDIYQKIAYWLKKTSNEVSGFGSLAWDEKSATFTVKDVILLKQEVGRTSTEICPIALGKAMFQMKDEPMGLKWHWHTHPNMGVFWSGDDMEIIKSLGQQGWIIATVFNEKGEHKSAFYTKTQVMGMDHDIFKDNLPTEVCRFLPSAFFRALDEEYDKCVSEVAKWVGPGTHTKIHENNKSWVEKEYGDHAGWSQYDDDYIKPIHTLDPKRWETLLEYSDTGYAQLAPGSWVYNPLHDKELKTQNQRMDMVDEMDESEINFLKKSDAEFQLLLSQYMVREANRKPADGAIFVEG